MNKAEESILEGIINEFRNQKLLSDVKIEELKRIVSSGKMKPEDWISLFDTDRNGVENGGIR